MQVARSIDGGRLLGGVGRVAQDECLAVGRRCPRGSVRVGRCSRSVDLRGWSERERVGGRVGSGAHAIERCNCWMGYVGAPHGADDDPDQRSDERACSARSSRRGAGQRSSAFVLPWPCSTVRPTAAAVPTALVPQHPSLGASSCGAQKVGVSHGGASTRRQPAPRRSSGRSRTAHIRARAWCGRWRSRAPAGS